MIRCRRRFGRFPCGGVLEHQVNHAGELRAVCPRCTRYARGLCVDCPRPRVGQQRRCAGCQHALHLARGRAWRRRHPDRHRAAVRRWQADHPTYGRDYLRTWRAAHRDRKRAVDRAWEQRHRAERIAAKRRRRQAAA